MITLFPHQTTSVQLVDDAFRSNQNVMLVLPTGAGKTIVKAFYAKRCFDNNEVCVIFAHRDVLLGQISDALCSMGVYHSFIASKPMINNICNRNTVKYKGNSFRRDTSPIIIASVDKFYRTDVSMLAPLVKMWMLDEAHHLTKGSKWDKCVQLLNPMLNNVKGLMVTATPKRADGKALGRKYEGLADTLVCPTNMGELITTGRLAPYKIFTPPDMGDVSNVRTTKGGDYNNQQLAKQYDKASITGDVIIHYRRICDGKQAICFSVNIAHGMHVAERFNSSGITAVNLSSQDTDAVRNKAIDDFKLGRIKVLVNCDLFGEGFDVPSVECVIFLRKTKAYSLFKQQMGRALRVLDGKECGYIIDHVGNVEYHMMTEGLVYPHDDPVWSLSPETDKKTKSVVTHNRKVCPVCFNQYIPTSVTQSECPECRHVETPAESVEALKKFQETQGELVEMNIDFVSSLIKRRASIDEPVQNVIKRMEHAGAKHVVLNSVKLKHQERQDAQQILRKEINDWCIQAWQNHNYPTDIIQREFELIFGVNILSAQVLGAREALALSQKVNEHDGL